MKKITAPLLLVLLLLTSCLEENETTSKPKELSFSTTSINSRETLGRILFYDNSLSLNNSVSCASCHKQALAFSDNVAFSVGFENVLTTRNSMPIQNVSQGFITFIDGTIGSNENTNVVLLSNQQSNFGDGSDNFFPDGAFVGSLFWDGRETVLRNMVVQPILNHKEMGIRNLSDVVKKINNIEYYQAGFKNVYQSDSVSLEMVSDALAAFVESLKSVNTKLDHSNMAGGVQLDALESTGRDLFFEKYDCNSCHQVQSPNGYLFSGGGFANIGLDPIYDDSGMQETSGNDEDAGKFKIPSLRNVALTAPYMHDGRFETLEEVIGHYSTGISQNENLDFRLKETDGSPMVFNITKSETRAIVAFLNTLTDYSMISNPDYSNPFK